MISDHVSIPPILKYTFHTGKTALFRSPTRNQCCTDCRASITLSMNAIIRMHQCSLGCEVPRSFWALEHSTFVQHFNVRRIQYFLPNSASVNHLVRHLLLAEHTMNDFDNAFIFRTVRVSLYIAVSSSSPSMSIWFRLLWQIQQAPIILFAICISWNIQQMILKVPLFSVPYVWVGKYMLKMNYYRYLVSRFLCPTLRCCWNNYLFRSTISSSLSPDILLRLAFSWEIRLWLCLSNWADEYWLRSKVIRFDFCLDLVHEAKVSFCAKPMCKDHFKVYNFRENDI